MFSTLISYWFSLLQETGLWGVFFLMALESSLVPIPSEIVIPPAAIWVVQGLYPLEMIVFMGAAGSLFGSLVNYWFARWVGVPFLKRYGAWFLLPEHRVAAGQRWISLWGGKMIFLCRLLPVMRHVISIPAGLLKMPLGIFCGATFFGAGIWCWILAYFGLKILGPYPELLGSADQFLDVLKKESHAFLIGIAVLALLAFGVMLATAKKPHRNQSLSL